MDRSKIEIGLPPVGGDRPAIALSYYRPTIPHHYSDRSTHNYFHLPPTLGVIYGRGTGLHRVRGDLLDPHYRYVSSKNPIRHMTEKRSAVIQSRSMSGSLGQ